MIHGTVNGRFEISLPFTIQDLQGNLHNFEALLDTGYSGYLTMPPPVIAVLGLPFHSQTFGTLANGQTHIFDLHLATIVWDGSPRSILVQAAESVPLVGLELMKGTELRVRFLVGGEAEIEKLP